MFVVKPEEHTVKNEDMTIPGPFSLKDLTNFASPGKTQDQSLPGPFSAQDLQRFMAPDQKTSPELPGPFSAQDLQRFMAPDQQKKSTGFPGPLSFADIVHLDPCIMQPILFPDEKPGVCDKNLGIYDHWPVAKGTRSLGGSAPNLSSQVRQGKKIKGAGGSTGGML